MVTQRYVDERRAYGRNKVHLPHVASFVTTGNNLQFLTDDTGNRRWLPFEVEDIDSPWEADIPYEGIYSHTYALYQDVISVTGLPIKRSSSCAAMCSSLRCPVRSTN